MTHKSLDENSVGRDFSRGELQCMSYPRYREYQHSGIVSLRRVPTHWLVLPLKRLGGFQAGAGFPENEQGDLAQEIPFFKVGDMGSPSNVREMEQCQHTVSQETARKLRAHVFPANTVVFAKVGAALMLNRRRILIRPSCIDNNMIGFVPISCDPKWAFYALSAFDIGVLANPGAVPSVNEGQLCDSPVVVPPLAEQRPIAAFLDRETAKIDALVAKKERLIELLQEKRNALITRAVTKGLNTDVRMRDSGVKWIGSIPVDWSVKKLKHMVPAVTVGIVVTPSKYYVAEGIPCLRSLNIAQGYVEKEDLVFISESANLLHRKSRIFESDIVVVRTGRAGVAAVVPSDLDGANCIDLLIIRRSSQIDSRFLYYFMNSGAVGAQVSADSVGSIQEHYNTGTLSNLCVPSIPATEQRGIVAFLDRETAKIDALISKVRTAIDRLKELRTALISAAVTGKIDVRDDAAASPEPAS